MTPLRQALVDYLRIRRQLGFKLNADGRLLERFVEFLEQAGAERITIDLAVRWARLPQNAHPHHWRQRLGIVRGFARYLATVDPASEVPPADLLAAHRARVAPYIYEPAEIRALMAAASALTPPLRAAAYETVIGLMAATGLRLGEALGLDRADVDLDGGTLHVRAGQTKQREVPLHPTTTEALENYARLRDRHQHRSSAFFITGPGRRLTHRAFYKTFPRLRNQAGLDGRGERGHVRAHDLRHTFAVRTLLDWHQAGVDIDTRLPLLSTYLGHLHPESTYWYLQAVPELLRLVARDLDGAIGGRR
jgi:integrase/recombinase XerD